MTKKPSLGLLLIFLSSALVIYLSWVPHHKIPVLAQSTAPVGSLDMVDSTIIGGWAKDDDYAGPIMVDGYIDGIFVKRLTADQWRPDVGDHGFHWNHPSFGPGNHRVNVYALGVDAHGNLDGINPELNLSPKTYVEPVEYPLVSPDGKVRVVVDARYGGAVSKIYDDENMPGKNLVIDDHGGALLQSCLWFSDRHSQVPPGCSADRSDMWYNNPTQGGFYKDVVDGTRLGNPIGLKGTDRSAFDENEFIRYEDSGKTVHFKSKWIRHDYCLSHDALMSSRELWDTDFYLEQWVYFNSKFENTLVERSKLTYAGSQPRTISTKQLPIHFARYLPRIAYWKSGQKAIKDCPAGVLVIQADENWAALIAGDKEAGVGMVISPEAMAEKIPWIPGSGGKGKFTCDGLDSVWFASDQGNLDFTTIGKVNNVFHESDHVWRFEPGGWAEWYVYFPIGRLEMIKSQAEAILADATAFGMPTTFTIQGYKGDCPSGTKLILDSSQETTAQPYFFYDVPSGTHTVTLELPLGASGYNISYSSCDCCINHPPESYRPGDSHSFTKETVCRGASNYYDLYWQCFLFGDLDGSGTVDSQDLKILLENWGDSSTKPEADLNVDGIVNGLDFGKMLRLIQ